MGTWSPGPGATAGNDAFTGNGDNETVDGLGGNDILNGGGGEDRLTGNSGDDIINPGDDYVRDSILAGAGIDTIDLSLILEDGILVQPGSLYRGAPTFSHDDFNQVEIVFGTQANDRMTGTSDTGFNAAYDLYGLGGDDWLVSLGGAILHGGEGRDVFAAAIGGGAINNTVADFEVGVDYVQGTISSISIDGSDTLLSFTGEFILRMTGVTGLTLEQWQAHQVGTMDLEQNSPGVDNKTGTALADWYYLGGGNDTANTAGGADMVSGGSGNDTINAGAGEDRIEGGSGNDTITGGSENDWLQGDSGNDTLRGEAGEDNLEGGAGDDSLAGGAGIDALHGGDGIDSASYSDAAAGVFADLSNPGANTGDAAGDVYDSLEGLTGSAHADTLRGNAQANVLRGGNGADLLEGGDGNDTLEGGAANDTLDGGAGADSMSGDAGDDIYVIDDVGDTVFEFNGLGTDTVQVGFTYTLLSSFERLTLTGAADINGTGNELANVITGNAGVNTLNGGTGVDQLIGGLGHDTYIIDDASDTVIEGLDEGTDTVRSTAGVAALAANVENLVLLGVAVNATGNDLRNVITGNAQNNNINGLAGADIMIGGLGNDTYFVDDLGDVVTEAAGQGTDIIFSTVNVAALALNVENLTISALALTATGNSLSNIISGNSQNNTLNGGSGEDTLIGGIGNDLYLVNSAGDVVTEGLGAGTDSILAFINIDALVANIENVTLAGAATSATGNELSNILTGNGLDNTLVGGLGNDQLNGGVGADTMSGGGGDDAYLVENAGDVTIELGGEGNNDIVYTFISLAALGDNIERVTITGVGNLDATGNALGNRVNGNANNNALLGLDGADVIQGLAGADIVNGGGGLDIMTGGADADTFVFGLTTDSGTTGATRDVINDFTQGSDLIDLTAIDAITGGGDDAFSLIGTAAFSNTAGELRYDLIDNPSGNDFTILSLDVDGDGLADSQITLIGLVTLTVSDFGL